MSTTINMNDFITKQQNEHTNAHTHVTVDDCTTTKLDADTLAKLNKGRRSNTYALTTNTVIVERATDVKQVLLDVDVNDGLITKYSVDAFEREYGELKLGVLYQHEISAYLQYINYIYVGTVYTDDNRTFNCGLYGFELLMPNMFKTQFVSLNMFSSEYTRYDDDIQLLGHMCTFIDN